MGTGQIMTNYIVNLIIRLVSMAIAIAVPLLLIDKIMNFIYSLPADVSNSFGWAAVILLIFLPILIPLFSYIKAEEKAKIDRYREGKQ